METQHPIDIRIWVKAPDRKAAVRVAHEKLAAWFSQPEQIIIGYGYPDGALMLYKILDENGECKARPSDPEPDPVVVPDPPQIEKVKCDDCGGSFPKDEMSPWKNEAGQDVLYCPSCDQAHQIMGCSFARPLFDFICEYCHQEKLAKDLANNPYNSAWVCKKCLEQKLLPYAPQGEGNGFDDIDTSAETPAEEHDRLSDRGRN